MPVHTRDADGFLHLVVDGDFTPGEIQRVGSSGLGGLDRPALLLDFSGAAGVERKEARDFEGMAAFLGGLAHQGRLALLTPAPAAALMEDVAKRAENHGLDARVFRTRAEAAAWLED